MNFASALFAMERGHKIKRPHWDGYWRIENGEVLIHCGDGRELNLRDSEDMVYTLRNSSCDDWLIINERKPYLR